MTAPTATKTDLALLGLLLDRPMHGYELYQHIQEGVIDAWFNVSMALVYYSLGKLRGQGLVVESRLRKGRSARKSIYRLTEEGHAAFFGAIEGQVASHERTHLDYDVAIYLLNKLLMERAIALLQTRMDHLAKQAEQVQASLARERDAGGASLKLAILDHKPPLPRDGARVVGRCCR